jgi:glutamate synthase domain-containing protein 3
MPQENLNKIWNAGKYFEPKPEQPTKEPTPDENKPSNTKRKINVAKAFIPEQEDPFKQKVEAVMKGIEEEPATVSAMAGKEEKSEPTDMETIVVGAGQDYIGKNLFAGESVRVLGDAGNWLGDSMSGGEIHVKGNVAAGAGYCMTGGVIRVRGRAGTLTGSNMSGGILRIDGDVASFHRSVFYSHNKGTIIWKGETIWEKGAFTEVGKELYGRRHNPFAKRRIRVKY